MSDAARWRRLAVALAVSAAAAALPAAPAGTAGSVFDTGPRPLALEQATNEKLASKVDAVFARWTSASPGCAVGVSVDAKTVLQRAYGMADLEHDAPNTPETIFEAGSVSKQFTAAAVLLLARDGKLSLDDPVRKHVPELPDYGAPVTVRMMLQHTSGLRDWGSVATIGGWPRGTRAYAHSHVLDIVRRQESLNFEPGTRWSYSNTGYNLAAMIVSRVAETAFAEFTRRRIFEPLGMARSSWRDDFTRVVKGRALAYSDRGGHYVTDMPFENAHGNGGLLTTVGDLLAWNANFTAPRVGDAEFVRLLQESGQFNDGRAHDYALGLFIGRYKGLPMVSHGGSTAGYRAFVARFPEQRLSVAVLCNAGNAEAEPSGLAVADLYLGDRARAPAALRPAAIPPERLDVLAGLYRNVSTGAPMTVARDREILRVDGNEAFVPTSAFRFIALDGIRSLEFDDRTATLDAGHGTVDSFERVPVAKPTAAQLGECAGVYVSEEAEVVMLAVVVGSELRLMRRPDVAMRLKPLYTDAFEAPLGTILFRRDASGRVSGFSLMQDRVWDLRFTRRAGLEQVR